MTDPTLAARAAEPISVEEIMRQYGDMNNADYEAWLASRTAVLADAVASELGCDDVSWSVGFSMGVAIAVRFGLTKADLETWATPVDPADLRSALPREEGK